MGVFRWPSCRAAAVLRWWARSPRSDCSINLKYSVCAEDYAHGKPAPDCFLLAAERLGVAPEHCLVFEDTQLGIDAATAAGMASVRVPQIIPGTEVTAGA